MILNKVFSFSWKISKQSLKNNVKNEDLDYQENFSQEGSQFFKK